MASGGEMHADLMGAAGFGPDAHQGGGWRIRKPSQHKDVAYSVARIARSHRHPFPFGAVTAERLRDRLAIMSEDTANYRKISFAYGPILELAREMGPGKWRAGNDHHARGILIEAMDDAGTHHAVRLGHPRELRKAGAGAHRRGWHWDGRGPDEPSCRRLVNSDQIIVGENHVDIRSFGGGRRQIGGRWLGDADAYRQCEAIAAARPGLPLTVTRPALIMRAAWEREYSGASISARN